MEKKTNNDQKAKRDNNNKSFQNLALNFQKSPKTHTNFYHKPSHLEDDLDFIERPGNSKSYIQKQKTKNRTNDFVANTEKKKITETSTKQISLDNKTRSILTDPKQQKTITHNRSEVLETVEASKPKNKSNPNDPLSLVGTKIDGKYEITKLLGQGGMGIVYLANHKFLNKKRAIKILPKYPPIPQEDVERFFKEATIAASIEHPNIVQVQDIEESERFYYIVMEYVEGISLDQYVKKYGHLSVLEASEIIRITSIGFAAIHDLGLIHRDIKPSNFMMTEEGKIKIMDFGIAKDLNNANASLTGENIIGTPQFMAPELITKNAIDHRSDIYSLGCTFYYLLTGKYCFSGSTMQIIYQVVNVPPIPPQHQNPDIPEAVSNIILKMLEKKPENRFGSMLDVELAIRNL